MTSRRGDPCLSISGSAGWLLDSGLAPLAVPDRDMPDVLSIDLSEDRTDFSDDIPGGFDNFPETTKFRVNFGTSNTAPLGDRPGVLVTDLGGSSGGHSGAGLSFAVGGDVTPSATSLSEYLDVAGPTPATSESSYSEAGDGGTAPDMGPSDLPAAVELDDDQCRLISVFQELADVAAGLRSLPEGAESVTNRVDGGWSPPSAATQLPWGASPLASPDREVEAAGRVSSLGEVDEAVRTTAEFSEQASRTSQPSQAVSPTRRRFIESGDPREPLASSGSEESLGPHVLRTDPAEDGDKRPVCAQVRLVVRTRAPGKQAVQIRSIRQFVDEGREPLEQAVCWRSKTPGSPSASSEGTGNPRVDLANVPVAVNVETDDLKMMCTRRRDEQGKAWCFEGGLPVTLAWRSRFIPANPTALP